MDVQHMRQFVGEDQLLPACIPGAQVEDANVPDTIHSSLKHTLPPNGVADFPLDPYLGQHGRLPK